MTIVMILQQQCDKDDDYEDNDKDNHNSYQQAI